MQMPGRKYTNGGSSYRYGFNGQEKSTEINDDSYTAEFWQYDSRIGRRFNIDPIEKVDESPYLCFGGNPIMYADPLGLDAEEPKTKTLPPVIITVKPTKQQKNRYAAIRKLMKKEHLEWWEASGDIDKNGKRYGPTPSMKVTDFTKNRVGYQMEKDIRSISMDMKINILKGAAIIEGSIPLLLSGSLVAGSNLVNVTQESIYLDYMLNKLYNLGATEAILTLRYTLRKVLSVDNMIRLEKMAGKYHNYKKLYKHLKVVKDLFETFGKMQ